MTKVSVVVPVYRVPLDYLRTCFDSLVVQTMQDCEFIVVSDGAPNEECSICEEYSKRDSRFKFFKKKHAGVSAARNFGINQAQGEYIAFVDCDDWISPNASSLIEDITQTNDFDLALMNSAKVWESEKYETLFKLSKNTKKINLKKLPHFAVWAYLFKRSIINKNSVKFNEKLSLAEDRAFIYQYCNHCKTIKTTNDLVYFYRQHDLSVCHQKATIESTVQQIKAAQYISSILKNNSNLSKSFVFHLTNRMIQMAIVGFIRNGYSQKDAKFIYHAFKCSFNGSCLRFYYIWHRARLTVLISKVFHL